MHGVQRREAGVGARVNPSQSWESGFWGCKEQIVLSINSSTGEEIHGCSILYFSHPSLEFYQYKLELVTGRNRPAPGPGEIVKSPGLAGTGPAAKGPSDDKLRTLRS